MLDPICGWKLLLVIFLFFCYFVFANSCMSFFIHQSINCHFISLCSKVGVVKLIQKSNHKFTGVREGVYGAYATYMASHYVVNQFWIKAMQYCKSPSSILTCLLGSFCWLGVALPIYKLGQLSISERLKHHQSHNSGYAAWVRNLDCNGQIRLTQLLVFLHSLHSPYCGFQFTWKFDEISLEMSALPHTF